MERLMFTAPPAVAGALVAVAVSTLCYGLISVARLFPYGQAIVTTIVLVGLSMIPIGTYLWLESLDLDGGEGLTAFLIAVFFCASGCFSIAFLVGLLLERRRKCRRQAARGHGPS